MQVLNINGGLDRLDRAMLTAMGVLIVATVLVILRGDQLGLTVQGYGPTGIGSSKAIISVKFDDPIQAASMAGRLTLSPAVAGKIMIAGNEIRFQPNAALQEGQTYTVLLASGVQASTGRALKQDLKWDFRVMPPRIAYLGPADNPVQNVFMVDPQQPDQSRQLTKSDKGVVGYDVAPDGSSIVYAELTSGGAANLRLLDLSSGDSRLLLECQDAACSNPVFGPDGSVVAFERVALNSKEGTGPSASRVWLLNLASETAKPLFADPQQVGNGPHWSPDGKHIAVYNLNAGGIVVHSFDTGKDDLIPTTSGEVGQFSPDGKWLTFPKIISLPDGGSLTHQVLVDLSSPYLVQSDLVPDSDPGDYKEVTWMPDSKQVVLTRPSEGAQLTGVPQIFSVDVATGKISPLVEDQDYSQNSLSISPNGDRLLFQRFMLTKPGARLEQWTYNFASHELKRVVENGTSARWMP